LHSVVADGRACICLLLLLLLLLHHAQLNIRKLLEDLRLPPITSSAK
jgi:succinate dehydrogenase hydrophobic anchor subunit